MDSLSFNVFMSFISAWLHGEHKFDAFGVENYIKECNKLGVIPASYFLRHVRDREFVMRNHGLGPLGAKAISKPLEVRTGST